MKTLRVLMLVFVIMLAACTGAGPAPTTPPTLGAVSDLGDATTIPLPTNTPVSLGSLQTSAALQPTTAVPSATVTATLLPTDTRILLPTVADIGIVATAVPTATLTPTITPTPLPTNTPLPTPLPAITRFLAQTTSVDALPLAMRLSEVSLSWAVQNRSPGTNLVFEQVFPDGRRFNVEKPRNFTAVPAEGSGSVVPFLPGGDARSITLRLRVEETATRTTLAQADLTVPVNRLPDSGFVTGSGEACFQQPYIPNSGFAVGIRGTVGQDIPAGVPLTAISGVGGQVTGSMVRGETFVIAGGPVCFRPPGSTTNYRQWQVRSELTGQQGWALEYRGSFTSYRSYLFPFRQYVVYDAAQCYSAPFLPDRGVRVGRGVALPPEMDYGLSVSSNTGDRGDPGYLEDLMPGEVITVLEGPYCFRFEPMPQTALGQRQWRVRSESTGLTGWVYEYSNERQQYIVPVADTGGEGPFEIQQFDVQPRAVTEGQPVTLTWEVTGVNGVDLVMWHDGLPADHVSLSGSGALLPLSGSLTVNAPEDVTSVRFSVFGANTGGYDGITVDITCRYPWFAATGAQAFCPNGAAQTHEAAYQPFENGYMVWFDDQIWAVWGGSNGAIYPDSWGGGDVVYPEAPPDGKLQPVRGFGTLWVSDANVRGLLGWATGPEQSYTLQIQQSDSIHRPGPRGGYNAADVLLSLPGGDLLAVTRSGNSFAARVQ